MSFRDFVRSALTDIHVGLSLTGFAVPPCCAARTAIDNGVHDLIGRGVLSNLKLRIDELSPRYALADHWGDGMYTPCELHAALWLATGHEPRYVQPARNEALLDVNDGELDEIPEVFRDLMAKITGQLDSADLKAFLESGADLVFVAPKVELHHDRSTTYAETMTALTPEEVVMCTHGILYAKCDVCSQPVVSCTHGKPLVDCVACSTALQPDDALWAGKSMPDWICIHGAPGMECSICTARWETWTKSIDPKTTPITAKQWLNVFDHQQRLQGGKSVRVTLNLRSFVEELVDAGSITFVDHEDHLMVKVLLVESEQDSKSDKIPPSEEGPDGVDYVESDPMDESKEAIIKVGGDPLGIGTDLEVTAGTVHGAAVFYRRKKTVLALMEWRAAYDAALALGILAADLGACPHQIQLTHHDSSAVQACIDDGKGFGTADWDEVDCSDCLKSKPVSEDGFGVDPKVSAEAHAKLNVAEGLHSTVTEALTKDPDEIMRESLQAHVDAIQQADRLVPADDTLHIVHTVKPEPELEPEPPKSPGWPFSSEVKL